MTEQIWKCFKWGGGCGRTAITSAMGSTACGCGGVMRPEIPDPPMARLKPLPTHRPSPFNGFHAPRPGIDARETRAYDPDEYFGRVSPREVPDLKAEAAERLRQAIAYARAHAPELVRAAVGGVLVIDLDDALRTVRERGTPKPFNPNCVRCVDSDGGICAFHASR